MSALMGGAAFRLANAAPVVGTASAVEPERTVAARGAWCAVRSGDGAFIAAVEDWRAGGDHARADGPGGTSGGLDAPSALSAVVALDVPVYRSAACTASAVGDGGVWSPLTAVPAGRMP